ncbi:MAG: maltose alpha-D-glucosyltransferase [Alphaproteobacteria bacterium]|nr:maltose alpha-D-glucosyltransferase [Alphaproteobacteria bacterium]
MKPAEPRWYKDAVVYEAHVKAFFDSDGDGVGDFAGLTQKLDYLQDLGVTALWLLPFYPSPLRDDGYDIADYREIHPSYGSMRDFKHFTRQAHDRNIKVITELVINHTSDQHPWFQRARQAPSGSAYRDWYVWSDNDTRFNGTRIIFTDTETSNWAWDPVAKAYYWHRFFSHQPDLNFDNPQVVKAVINTMRYWFDMGVDGMRLDAIPYLCEREGTSNENLGATHAVIKRLRAALDAEYPDRMFLAEANQWPEDVQQYFGEGDECHMAYHFPLMPRMYMAIAQEDRHPITDIMRQTPEIPDSCQWAIFLRNHDELTLEMVTDSERDYLWHTYASDRRARINLGIRRRLAPLLENDRRKIELMKSLLLSMPGTPFLYYGDEIGMGDNIFLGDRNGVRTPMQWTPDRNGGFSRADPASLYLPPLMDPIYGYQSVNVEAQSRNPHSLLNWTKRMIAIRQARHVFGRGTLTFLYPSNRSILAYLRILDDEVVLCVANLSRSAQAFELDLSAYAGRVPIELIGRSSFPLVGSDPYRLTLQGHAFLWFQLANPSDLRAAPAAAAERLPEFVTLVLSEGWATLSSGRTKTIFEDEVLRAYLPLRRWYAAKDTKLVSASVAASCHLKGPGDGWLLTILETKFADDRPAQRYLMPLMADWREVHTLPATTQALTLARLRKGPREGTLYDAAADDAFALAIVDAVKQNIQHTASSGNVKFASTHAFAEHEVPEQLVVRQLGVEQSNTSVLIEDYLVLKLYRRLTPGVHPELEMGRFLTDTANFRNVPPLLGSIEFEEQNGERTALGCLHGFVRNQGDGWSYTRTYLSRFLDECVVLPAEELAARKDDHDLYVGQLHTLGVRTAELHHALCSPTTDQAFRTERFTNSDLQSYLRAVREGATSALKALSERIKSLPEDIQQSARILLDNKRQAMSAIGMGLPSSLETMKSRYHGDYHLGQVVIMQNDFFILDFEGEPTRSLEERRRKHTPLKDVAGLLRSLDYAAWAALDRISESHPDRRELLTPHVISWRDLSRDAFLRAYQDSISGCATYPADVKAAEALLNLATLEKLFYEIKYELANRPAWLGIPIAGAITALGLK